MMKKIVGYLKENAAAQSLERRSSMEWEAKGTKEEFVKMVKYQERKRRNNTIAYAMYGGILLIGHKKYKEQMSK